MRPTLRKSELLRGKRNFQQVFEQGIRHNGTHIRCYVLERARPSMSPLAVGFVVRRTITRAVDRNRLKRLLRESYRKNKFTLVSSMEKSAVSLAIAFMAAPQRGVQAKSLTYAAVEEDMKFLLSTIARDHRS